MTNSSGDASHQQRPRLRPSRPSRPGDLVGPRRYRIVRLIGSGGTGDVYEALDTALGGAVALKTLKPTVAGNAVQLERFRREIQNARKVTHPTSAASSTSASTAAQGRGALLPDDGAARRPEPRPAPRRRPGSTTPTEALPDRRADRRRAAGRPRRPASSTAISSPATSCCSPPPTGRLAPRAVITDFGIALSDEQGDIRLTQSGELLGTPEYMAPEQAELGPAHSPPPTSTRSASSLYEMLCGRRPFDCGRDARSPPCSSAGASRRARCATTCPTSTRSGRRPSSAASSATRTGASARRDVIAALRGEIPPAPAGGGAAEAPEDPQQAPLRRHGGPHGPSVERRTPPRPGPDGDVAPDRHGDRTCSRPTPCPPAARSGSGATRSADVRITDDLASRLHAQLDVDTAAAAVRRGSRTARTARSCAASGSSPASGCVLQPGEALTIGFTHLMVQRRRRRRPPRRFHGHGTFEERLEDACARAAETAAALAVVRVQIEDEEPPGRGPTASRARCAPVTSSPSTRPATTRPCCSTPTPRGRGPSPTTPPAGVRAEGLRGARRGRQLPRRRPLGRGAHRARERAAARARRRGERRASRCSSPRRCGSSTAWPSARPRGTPPPVSSTCSSWARPAPARRCSPTGSTAARRARAARSSASTARR